MVIIMTDETISETIDDKSIITEDIVAEDTNNVSNDAVDSSKPNAHQTEEYATVSADEPTKYSFSMPSYKYTTFVAKIQDFNNINLERSGMGKWQRVVQDSVEFYTSANMYNSLFEDNSRNFQQGFKDNAGNLSSITNFKLKSVEGEIKGELALLKVAKHLGLGDIIRVPLPHSGIWVTLKPPTEKDMVDFYNNLYRDKISLGRSTSGLTLSNFSVFINNALMDFIIAHVHSINYSDIPISDLKNHISIHDIPILAWGFASTIYPNGYDYNRACLDVEKCTHVTHGKINLSKLLWIDNTALSEAQRIILSEFRPNKLTVDNYNKYKAEHVKLADTYFETASGVKINLSVPTVEDYFTDGLQWVNSINNKIESVVIDDRDNKHKDSLLDQYVKSTVLRQYNHFISSVEVDGNTISDRETINNLLEMLSSNDEIRTKIIEEVNKYISNTTIAVIGIPEYECPVCKANQNPDPVNDRFVNVIPLDTINLFFSLITLRISQILEREI